MARCRGIAREAALFAGELFRMYSRYAERQGWKIDVMSTSETGIGGVKTLRIFARASNGQTQTFEYREGDVLDGSRFAGWSGGRWGDSDYRGGWGEGQRGQRGDEGAYRIQQALYGTSRRNVDVTDRLRELARSDRSFRLTNELFGTDPAEGRVKTLRIYTRGPGGTSKTFEYREGSVIDGAQFAGWGRGDWGQDGRRGGWGR